MRVIFKTNIDLYSTGSGINAFPDNISIPPRIGESVMVKKDLKNHYDQKKLPIRLEVVDVVWSENEVICELWYKKSDIEAAKLSGTNLL